MKVNYSSWHARMYRWALVDPDKTPPPTVCGYWATVFITPVLAVVLTIALYPVIWVFDKLEEVFKGKSICPFGKVEFKE